ncbi:MAG: class B sortase [Clostridia bacterium]|nr:class B sortase [Clostridia bacterium]
MRKSRIFFMIGAAAFAALFLFAGGMAYRQYADQKESSAAFNEVAELIRTAKPIFPDITQTEGEGDADTETAANGETDTEAALEQSAYETYKDVFAANSDFVGWISIDGTNINYPVMQTPNSPDFYLKRGFDKNYSDYGVPYVQENCLIGQSDNCVIYGHHMKDGSIFADLCKYESESFYREHPVIRFDTLAGFGEYEIVCVFKTAAYAEDGFKYYHFVDAENEEAFQAFMRSCQALALYDTGVSAEYGDKLITLSTCEYSRTNGRMVVVAKRVMPSSTEESDA